MKIFTWIMANAASVLGALQAILKAVKELLTAVVNLVSIFLPAAASNALVDKVRGFVNIIDDGIEWVKDKLLGI